MKVCLSTSVNFCFLLKTEEAFEDAEEVDRILEPEERDDEDGEDETEGEEKEHRCSMFFHEQWQLVYFIELAIITGLILIIYTYDFHFQFWCCCLDISYPRGS